MGWIGYRGTTHPPATTAQLAGTADGSSIILAFPRSLAGRVLCVDIGRCFQLQGKCAAALLLSACESQVLSGLILTVCACPLGVVMICNMSDWIDIDMDWQQHCRTAQEITRRHYLSVINSPSIRGGNNAKDTGWGRASFVTM
jgi:hypothetical protein